MYAEFTKRVKGYTSRINTSTIFMVAIIIIFISVSIYFYVSKFKHNFKYNLENNTDNNNNNTSQAELMLFSVDWCPHCKKAKPIWEDLKQEYENKTVNGYTIIFTDIDCTNENPEVEKIINKYKIEGYPTIKLLKNGQVIEYDAKPSKATLEEFLNTVL
jgi:thiol-disulfide isomerase/thioredoxin